MYAAVHHTKKNAAAAVTATAYRILTLSEAKMLKQDTTPEVGLLDAVRNLANIASEPAQCTTTDCKRPQVDQATKDALSVLGLISTRCAECTRARMRTLLEVTA